MPKDKRGESPFSTDANLLHTSSEGKVLEDPWEETPDYVYSRTVNPEDAPDAPEYITIDFEKGDGVALNGVAMSPASLLTALNELGRTNTTQGSKLFPTGDDLFLLVSELVFFHHLLKAPLFMGRL